ncbi:MAG TPA: AAA family ATPase [Gemmatimonadales bacterium]|nr:AAA family ATPase [Gemmatimonadales bacterium]
MTHGDIIAEAERLLRQRERITLGTRRDGSDSATLQPPREKERLTEGPSPLKTFSVRELADDPSLMEPPEFVVGGLLPLGCLALLYGPPKSGKTTLAAHLAAAVALGRSFLGRVVVARPTLYCDFERPKRLTLARLMEPLAETDLPDALRLYNGPRVELARFRATLDVTGARFAVLDTLLRLLHPRDENDAAEMSDLLAPWADLAHERGVTFLAVHHDRKSQGNHGEGIRGSSAILGTVDLALYFRREGTGEDDGRRRIELLSNFDGLPSHLVLAREGGTYRVAPSAAEERQGRLLVAMGSSWETAQAIANRLGLTRQAIHDDLAALLAEGRVERNGSGRKKDPYLYCRADSASDSNSEKGYGIAETTTDPGDAWEPPAEAAE